MCQFAVCWTYIFINLALTKLFSNSPEITAPQGNCSELHWSQTAYDNCYQLRSGLRALGCVWHVNSSWSSIHSRLLSCHRGSFLLKDCMVSPNTSGWECFSAEVAAAISAESSLKAVFIERENGKTTSLFWNVILLLNYLLPLLPLLPQVFFQVKCP